MINKYFILLFFETAPDLRISWVHRERCRNVTLDDIVTTSDLRVSWVHRERCRNVTLDDIVTTS